MKNNMSFFTTIKKRRSIRSFSIRHVEVSKINKILKVASMSPSAKGLQSFRIYIVINENKKQLLVKAAHDQKYVNAPLLLVFCTEPKRIKKIMGTRGKDLFSVQDATIAASYAQLASTALGLSSVWIGNFNEKSVQKIIKTKFKPVVLLPIGYPNEKPDKKQTRKLKDIIYKV